MTRPDDHRRLRVELDVLANTAGDTMAKNARAAGFEASLRSAPWALLIIPGLWVVVRLGAAALNVPAPDLPAWLVFLLAPSPVAIWLVFSWLGLPRVDRRRALAAVDRDLGLRDRLVTADQFLREDERSPFMEAAIQDATRVTPRALRTPLATAGISWRPGRAEGLAVLASLLIFVAGIMIGPPPEAAAGKPSAWPAWAGVESDDGTSDEAAEDDDEQRPAEKPAAPTASAKPRGEGSSEGGPEQSDLSSEMKKTDGRTGTGQPADAASASGTGQSRGAPSNQAQSAKASKKKAKKDPPKKKKKKKPDDGPQKERKPQKESGATAGRGAASGSNRSPSASVWSSKDQVVSDDEEDLEDDEEVDDEFDDDESRGGVQPNLRDRKPPVNRDLGIGFGNGKNPDANGRGGPSEQKKSRGVASLVLGVPIPDHIKGRPNPGKTKITQERVEPRIENTKPVSAEDRGKREASAGWLSRPELAPWMRELVKNYYLDLRSKTAGGNSGR